MGVPYHYRRKKCRLCRGTDSRESFNNLGANTPYSSYVLSHISLWRYLLCSFFKKRQKFVFFNFVGHGSAVQWASKRDVLPPGRLRTSMSGGKSAPARVRTSVRRSGRSADPSRAESLPGESRRRSASSTRTQEQRREVKFHLHWKILIKFYEAETNHNRSYWWICFQ